MKIKLVEILSYSCYRRSSYSFLHHFERCLFKAIGFFNLKSCLRTVNYSTEDHLSFESEQFKIWRFANCCFTKRFCKILRITYSFWHCFILRISLLLLLHLLLHLLMRNCCLLLTQLLMCYLLLVMLGSICFIRKCSWSPMFFFNFC